MVSSNPAGATTVGKNITPPREYVVLMRGAAADDHNPIWIEVGRATAATRDDALDRVVDTLDKDEQDGPFIAVAARYWVQATPKVEVKTTRSWK